jgi:hypothetical protein
MERNGFSGRQGSQVELLIVPCYLKFKCGIDPAREEVKGMSRSEKDKDFAESSGSYQ